MRKFHILLMTLVCFAMSAAFVPVAAQVKPYVDPFTYVKSGRTKPIVIGQKSNANFALATLNYHNDSLLCLDLKLVQAHEFRVPSGKRLLLKFDNDSITSLQVNREAMAIRRKVFIFDMQFGNLQYELDYGTLELMCLHQLTHLRVETDTVPVTIVVNKEKGEKFQYQARALLEQMELLGYYRPNYEIYSMEPTIVELHSKSRVLKKQSKARASDSKELRKKSKMLRKQAREKLKQRKRDMKQQEKEQKLQRKQKRR